MWRKKTRGVELYAKNLSFESRTIVTQGACMKSLVVVKHGCTTTNLRQKIVQCSGVYRWKPPQIAKRNRSQKKVLHTITFNSGGITLYKPREDGSSITGKYYREYTLAEVNSFTTEFDQTLARMVSNFVMITASAQICILVQVYLVDEKWKLPHPAYFPEPAPGDFVLFPNLSKINVLLGEDSTQDHPTAIFQCLSHLLRIEFKWAFLQ